MTEFEYTCCGVGCIIRVLSWESHRPAYIGGPPENCYPAEGGEGEWEVLDCRGQPAPWLEAQMSHKERLRIDEAVFDHMES